MFDTRFDSVVAQLSQPQPGAELLSLLPYVSRAAQGMHSGGLLLHNAAKWDTIFARGAEWVKLMVEEYGFDPNIQSSDGSVPLLWAVSAYVHNPASDFVAVSYLIWSPLFDRNRSLKLRGNVHTHVQQYYSWSPRGREVLTVLERRRDKDRVLLLLARLRCRRFVFSAKR